MACTKARLTPSMEGKYIVLSKASSTTIYEGSLVAVNSSGQAIPAAKAASQPAVGMAYEVDGNTVKVERGVHLWDNDATGAVTAANIGGTCYIVDDCTVTSTSTGSSSAGKVLGLEGDQVIVETL